MKFIFETTTPLTPEKIWPLYADINRWSLWENQLEAISIAGAFETGTLGEMTLKGQPPMAFTLESVIPNKEFSNKTTIPNVGELDFRHVLSWHTNHTIVSHSVAFIPEKRSATVDDAHFIAQIFSDVPASVFALIEAAK